MMLSPRQRAHAAGEPLQGSERSQELLHEHNRSRPAAVAHAELSIGSDDWDLFVFGITRVGRDAFIQLTLLGPRECTITVRAPSAMIQGVTVRQILDVICDWLLSGDVRPHVYLELPATSERPF
jgi:hypothetical protein